MPIDLDRYREASLANWEKISGNWEAERDYIWSATSAVSERMVERLDPQPGDTVLDIAAGTGDTGFIAANNIGADGRLVSTDFAEGMVEAARRNGESQGLENVEYRVLDAENMDFDDSSFDGVLARFGYMLMAEPAKALAETRRILRDDGRLVFAVWATPDKNMWAAIPGMAMVERGLLPAPEPGAPGIFAMGEPDRIRELVTGAGFDEPEIEQVEVKWPYVEPDEHWQMTMKLAGPLADAIGQLEEEDREAVRQDVRARIEPLMDGGVGGLVHVVSVG
jgi:SAM-dependent methyltransferase